MRRSMYVPKPGPLAESEQTARLRLLRLFGTNAVRWSMRRHAPRGEVTAWLRKAPKALGWTSMHRVPDGDDIIDLLYVAPVMRVPAREHVAEPK